VDALPLPEHPVLHELAAQLESDRYAAELWDEHWRLVWATTDYLRSCSITAQDAIPAVGLPVYSARAAEIRQRWPGFATRESWAAMVRRLLPAIAADLPGGIDELRAAVSPELEPELAGLTPLPGPSLSLDHADIKFGRRTTPFLTMGTRIFDGEGAFAGTAWIVVPAVSGATLSLLASGDHRPLERLTSVVRPARRPGAVLFADLEGSTALARRLPATEYFTLVRRLMTVVDDEIVQRGGLVGKHAGDGATAFFLTEQHETPSAAARACIASARAIRGHTAAIAERCGLAADEVVVRFGLHWGATLYVGRLLTSGRADVTALGDQVNEAARIEACATGGRALASKDLIEQLDAGDAQALGLASAGLRFTVVSDLDSATDKARRDAPSIAVCEV
jgi:class 3 adenylate cyclase